jgi:putative hydrolases of HD superfamily
MAMNIKKIVNYIFEIGQLFKKENTGWQLVGISDPASVADHILRAAQIGYIIALMENANPEKVVSIILIHDNGKTRIGDQHKVAAKYMFKKEAEEMAFEDQIDGIDKNFEKSYNKYFAEFNDRSSKEGIVARDADWLEQAFQAKEYYDLGMDGAWVWIKNVEEALETVSAKIIINELKKTKFTDWWKDLMVMTYKKIN